MPFPVSTPFSLAMPTLLRSIEPMKRTKKRPAEVLVEKRLLTPAELAASLNVPIWKARELWRTGKIPAIRLGHRTVRFDFTEVLKALQNGNQAA